MNTRYERRSKEAPMDFEWTNKNRDVIASDSPFRSAAKRSHTDMATPDPPFPQHNPATPTFGANRDVPFMFNQPRPSSTPTHHWAPPPSKTLQQSYPPEINDVTMQDASPPKPEEPDSSPGVRTVAAGAMRRVFRARQKHGAASREQVSRRRRIDPDEDDYGETDEDGLSESDQLGEMISPQTRRRGLRRSHSDPITTANHNHHYTFQVPAPQLSHSDIPYLLLGYLQFFFNLSLVLGLLYLAFQFLQTVRKDVEQKMTEYAIDSLHEIRACARHYEENFCAGKPSPIIVHQCYEWKECMERDASIVGRTRIFAELVGEVINGFMEPITWRTLESIFTLASLSMGIAFVNVLLMFYRGRHTPVNMQPMPHTQPTPSFPMYSVSSPPPYWGQSSSAPLSSHPSTPRGGMRQAWSTSAIEGEGTEEMPSRRRRINEDDIVKVR